MRDTPTSQNSLHFGVAERRAALFSALKAIPVDVANALTLTSGR